MAKPKPKAKAKAAAKPVAKKSTKPAKPVAKKAAPAPKQAAAPAQKPVPKQPVAAKPAAGKPAAPAPAAKPAAAKPAAAPKKPAATGSASRAPTALRTLRSCIYQVDDLPRAKAFYAAALDRAPYFDEPYYVGFDVDGVELGLDPDVSERRPGRGGAVGYWQVDEVAATFNQLLALGGAAVEQPHDVGGGVHIAIVADPCGNLVGLVQRP